MPTPAGLTPAQVKANSWKNIVALGTPTQLVLDADADSSYQWNDPGVRAILAVRPPNSDLIIPSDYAGFKAFTKRRQMFVLLPDADLDTADPAELGSLLRATAYEIGARLVGPRLAPIPPAKPNPRAQGTLYEIKPSTAGTITGTAPQRIDASKYAFTL